LGQRLVSKKKKRKPPVLELPEQFIVQYVEITGAFWTELPSHQGLVQPVMFPGVRRTIWPH